MRTQVVRHPPICDGSLLATKYKKALESQCGKEEKYGTIYN